jgi:hypothetical protein
VVSRDLLILKEVHMIERLWRWLVDVETDAKPARVERFGEVTVDSDPGLAILEGTVERRNLCESIRFHMGIYAEQREQLVERLLLRFALYVGDLQASEKHHHAVPYGLIDHSLQVAQKVALALGGPCWRVSEDYATNRWEKPPWIYSALVAALFHDLGKVLDLEVATPDQKDRWNPQVEPLSAFSGRNGLKKTGPEYWSYRRGRGYNSHDLNGSKLFPLVLPPQAGVFLGHRLAHVSQAMLALTLDRPPVGVHEFAVHIAKAIHKADIESSKEDRAPKKKAPEPFVPGPVPRLAPVPVAPLAEPPVADLVEISTPASVPAQRPPVDLDLVLRDFTSALRVAVEKGWIPLNQEGGLYIGRKYVYLQVPEGMDKVVQVMTDRGSDLEDRWEDDRAAQPEIGSLQFTPQTRIIRALLAQKRLPFSTDDSKWIQHGAIFHPGGSEPWDGQVVLMSSMPFQDLPVFQGRMDLHQIGDPEGEEKKSPAPQPLETAARRARPSAEAYLLRVEGELEPERLLATLTDALRVGVFHRPGAWSPICIRPDFTWVLVPEAFKILLPRLGIVFSEDLENRILKSISRMTGLAPGEDGKVLLRVKVHPESPQAVWAFAIETGRILPAEMISSLECWPHPIRVIKDSVPGEYAA